MSQGDTMRFRPYSKADVAINAAWLATIGAGQFSMAAETAETLIFVGLAWTLTRLGSFNLSPN
jgi:hypothetical protein